MAAKMVDGKVDSKVAMLDAMMAATLVVVMDDLMAAQWVDTKVALMAELSVAALAVETVDEMVETSVGL
jgi:hypothetical protein